MNKQALAALTGAKDGRGLKMAVRGLVRPYGEIKRFPKA